MVKILFCKKNLYFVQIIKTIKTKIMKKVLKKVRLEKFNKQSLNSKQLLKTEGGPVSSRGTVTRARRD